MGYWGMTSILSPTFYKTDHCEMMFKLHMIHEPEAEWNWPRCLRVTEAEWSRYNRDRISAFALVGLSLFPSHGCWPMHWAISLGGNELA
jgi:hypothetical protein